jgi:signal transduction histidine kinase
MTLHDIRVRLTVWYALVLCIALLATDAVTYVVARKQIRRSDDAALVSTTRNFLSALRDEIDEGHGVLRLRAANELLAEFRDNGRGIVLLHPDGSEFAAHQTPVARSLDRDGLRRRTKAREFGLVTVAGGAARLDLAPVNYGAESFVVAAAQSLAPQEETLANLRTAMLATAPAALLVAALGGYFLARKNLEPVARSFTEQRRFMADASHELRTPVAILQGELDVTLSRDDRNAAEYRESLEVMHKTVRRLTRIVRDLFLLARSDAGDIPVKREPLYAGDLVSQTARAYKNLAAERGVALVAECADDLLIDGDEDLLQRMIGNLLENAIRHTEAGREVRVRCLAGGNVARIEVWDQGDGVPSELREQIFERFFRVDPARTGSGAGLGLPIARWIAEVHGGALWLERSGADGSVFVSTLPRSSRV